MSIISSYRSASVLKIINEYAILDKVLHIDKGSMITTKNLVYDAETGESLVTETQNDFNNPLYSFNYPAHWAYQGMEMAYKNIDARFKGVIFRNGIIENPQNVDMSTFESGDEIYVFDDMNPDMLNTRSCYKLGDPLYLPRITDGYNKIWAIDITKDSRNGATKKFIFVDKLGVPFNSIGTDIRIVRSGKRNMITASVGSITSLVNPIVASNIVINNNTKVLNAGAVEYKEKWKVEDGFYSKFENTLLNYYAPIYSNLNKNTTNIFTSETKNPADFWYCWSHSCPILKSSNKYFEARGWDNGNNSADFGASSYASFNLNDIGPTKKIVSAKLSLFAHSGLGGNFLIHPEINQLTNNHYTSDPHKTSQYPYSNDFWIKRVYDKTSNPSWTLLYNSDNKIVSNFNNAYGSMYPYNTTGYMSSTKSFCTTCNDGYDNRIDVTGLVKDMLFDKYVNNRTGEGIKIELAGNQPTRNPQSAERRVCFSSGFSSITQLNASDGPGPELDIKYYDPSQISTTPPLGEFFTYQDYNWQYNCYSFMARQQMNPYILGLLGNWRVSKNYVFYGDRTEKDPTVQTDLKANGTIDNFSPYWGFTAGGVLPNITTNKWVWNSQISLVNKKGFEVENYDALLRFNSGIYGYNSNLPIAIANNAKYRETGFDGFEDYLYKDKGAIAAGICKDSYDKIARHWKMDVKTSDLTTEKSHTGTSSIKIQHNSSFSFTNNVSTNISPTDPDVKLEMLDQTYNDTKPVYLGTGLLGKYYENENWSGSPKVTVPAELPYLDFAAFYEGSWRYLSCSDCFARKWPKRPPVRAYDITTTWTGYIFLEDIGNYDFAFQSADDYARVRLYPASGSSSAIIDCEQYWGSGQNVVTAHNLAQGLYKIQVDFKQFKGNGFIKLLWKTPTSSLLVPLPINVLYPSQPPTNTPVIHCIKPGTIQGVANSKLDEFDLIQGTKMVLSAWVMVGDVDCQCKSYDTKTNIQVSFTGAGIMPTIDPAIPTGNIINGWQKIETVFDVPNTASSITISVNNLTNASNLYMDDIRIHPYSSNLKSFVYHPVTLRLMADLDENNYASFYEYDNDGTLTRVKKETKEGIKTIKETRSAIQKNIIDIQP